VVAVWQLWSNSAADLRRHWSALVRLRSAESTSRGPTAAQGFRSRSGIHAHRVDLQVAFTGGVRLWPHLGRGRSQAFKASHEHAGGVSQLDATIRLVRLFGTIRVSSKNELERIDDLFGALGFAAVFMTSLYLVARLAECAPFPAPHAPPLHFQEIGSLLPILRPRHSERDIRPFQLTNVAPVGKP
jgi:hypothetical protein